MLPYIFGSELVDNNLLLLRLEVVVSSATVLPSSIDRPPPAPRPPAAGHIQRSLPLAAPAAAAPLPLPPPIPAISFMRPSVAR